MTVSDTRPRFEVAEELIARFRSGDRRAGDTMLIMYDGFIRAQAIRWRVAVEVDDAIQVARGGFLVALGRYDPDRGSLLKCCSIWIRASLMRYRRNLARTVRLPSYLYDAMAKKDDPVRREEARSAWRTTGCISMETRIHEDQTVEDLLVAAGEQQDEELWNLQQDRTLQWLAQMALSSLNDRQRDILQRRYMGEVEETLEEIAESYKVTRQRIQQLEAEAAKKLRVRLGMVPYRNFKTWLAEARTIMTSPTGPVRASAVRRSKARGRTVLRTA